jgi:hypothetical protein
MFNRSKTEVAYEVVEARVPPENVWELWEKAHAKNGQPLIEKGQVSYSKGEGKSQFKYEILDVLDKQRFSILWKTLFVRLIFTHEVTASDTGSRICYRVDIRGFFGRPVRWLLGAKIRQNISLVLKAVVRQLELDS